MRVYTTHYQLLLLNYLSKWETRTVDKDSYIDTQYFRSLCILVTILMFILYTSSWYIPHGERTITNQPVSLMYTTVDYIIYYIICILFFINYYINNNIIAYLYMSFMTGMHATKFVFPRFD